MKCTFCKSVTDMNPVTRDVSWAEMVEMLQNVVYQQVTRQQLCDMGGAARYKYKDVGGFIGGVFQNNSRRKQDLLYRTLITIDIDEAKPDVTLNAMSLLLYRVKHVIYTTFSSTPAAPRYRVVIPVSREMKVGEWEEITRWIERQSGVKFDPCSYKPAQLMFFPATTYDAEGMEVIVHRGQTLDVDRWLDEIHGIKPYDPDEYDNKPKFTAKVTQTGANEAENVANEGETGAKPMISAAKLPETAANRPEMTAKEFEKYDYPSEFNRTFTIEQAIAEFLPNIYIKDAATGRYRYYKSDSAAGGVVYDNGTTFYSNHSNDPAYQKLLTAYQLVKLHITGEPPKDEPESPKEKMKQWQWRMGLRTNRQGIESSLVNVCYILRSHPDFKGLLALDEFTNQVVITRPTPWSRVDKNPRWNDYDLANLKLYLEHNFGIRGNDMVVDGVNVVACEKIINPFKSWLQSLKWDGTPRLEGLFRDYLGTEDTEYNRTVGKIHLTAAVKRVMEPGCKYDSVVMLQGAEGKGKSWFCQNLAPEIDGRQFCSGSLSITDFGQTSFIEKTRNNVILEIPEFVGADKRTIESIKSCITLTEDTARMAYARYQTTIKRHFVFFITTNDPNPLRGDTGNRRFLLIQIKPEHRRFPEDNKRLLADREQLWAEAMVLYLSGYSINIMDYPEQLRTATRLQEQTNEIAADPMKADLEQYLDTDIPNNWTTLSPAQRRNYYLNGHNDTRIPLIKRQYFNAADFLWERYSMPSNDTRARSLVRKINILMKLHCASSDWQETRVPYFMYGKSTRGYKLDAPSLFKAA